MASNLHKRLKLRVYRDLAVGDAHHLFLEARDGCALVIVGRFSVGPSDSMLEVKLKALGAYRWQSCVQRMRRRLRRAPQNTSAQVLPAYPA
jgi:hypothetical protein